MHQTDLSHSWGSVNAQVSGAAGQPQRLPAVPAMGATPAGNRAFCMGPVLPIAWVYALCGRMAGCIK